jgi:hypothetical protein
MAVAGVVDHCHRCRQRVEELSQRDSVKLIRAAIRGWCITSHG